MKHLPVVLLTVSACYGKAVAPPKRPAATELQPGATATLNKKHHNQSVRGDDIIEAFSTYDFRYGVESKTYTEYRAIVDPNWTKTLDRYDALYKTCIGAKTPLHIAGYTMLAGMIVTIVGLDKERGLPLSEQKITWTGVGIAGVAGLIWGAGYWFFGGRACNKADDMYRWKAPWLENADKNDPIVDWDLDKELTTLTKDFNARIMNAPAAEPAAEPPSE